MLSTVKIIFYLFSAMVLLASSMVVISKNPVKAVLWLVLTFFAAAGLWILLEAPFLAVTLVLVYVGAVMVLFLFVVMMLDVEQATVHAGFIRHLPLGLLVSALVIGGLSWVLRKEGIWLDKMSVSLVPATYYADIKNLGILLYSQYLYAFEIAGIILLTAIVAAISLTFRGRRGSKAPNPNWQIGIQKEERVSIVKMESYQEPV